MFDDDGDVDDNEEQYDDGTVISMTHKHTKALASYDVCQILGIEILV